MLGNHAHRPPVRPRLPGVLVNDDLRMLYTGSAPGALRLDVRHDNAIRLTVSNITTPTAVSIDLLPDDVRDLIKTLSSLISR